MLLLERTIQMKIIGGLSRSSCAVRLLAALLSLATITVLTYAEDNKKPSTTPEDQKQVNLEPMTITVTAQKEPQPALSTPLSITAVTEEDLTNAGLQAVRPAASYAPNTFVNEFSARALSNPFFRGIGGSPTNPAVSTVIDGVPQLNSFSSNIELIDIGQIEFVRGPEGALYGRNTAGGLINITSRELANAWAAKGQAEFGNYNRQDVRASASSPLLKDRFGFSVSGGYAARDGYTVNDATARDLDYREAGFGKIQLFFKISGKLRFRFIYSGEKDIDGDYALGDLGYIRDNPNHVSRDFEGFNRRSVQSTSFVVDYQGSAVDFSSITGGVWWRNHALTDLDYQVGTYANYGLFATRDNVETQHQFTQEFRFSSVKDRPVNVGDALKLNWQAGVFIFNQNYQQDAINNISSTFGFFPGSISSSSADLGDTGVGLYGKAQFTAWKKLSLTAGVRFDYESKNAELRSSSGPATSPSDSFSEVSPQFSVAYQFTADHMAYASVTRGYKAGGFNPAPTGIPAPAGIHSFDAEHTWNYELGHKAMWLKDKLESTVAIFYIDWKNLQLNQQIPFSGGQYFIGNAGKANSKGLEAETKYRPFAWWELFGMVGYTRARFLSGSSAFNANMGINQAVGGNTLPYAPTFNANVGTQVSWVTGHYAKFYFRIQLAKYGDFQYDASNAAGQTGYQLVNLRGGVRAKHWFAEGWADNAFDAHYVPIAIPYAQLGAPSGYIGETGAPVTYGVRLGLNF
jgi:iron complex outermembrane recepter protein